MDRQRDIIVSRPPLVAGGMLFLFGFFKERGL